jgi:predicted acyltransferase
MRRRALASLPGPNTLCCMKPSAEPTTRPAVSRLASIDAYRGLVMFLMMAEVLRLARAAAAVPGNAVLRFLAQQQTHVEWAGCVLHDLIQPSFSFLVGVALPFSLASRRARGQSTLRILFHAAWRSLVLVALGIFLRSLGHRQTNFTFEDTLTQIGLGYFPLVLLGLARPRWHVVALVVILAGYWAAFALYPLPGEGVYSVERVGVPPDWPHHYEGFEAHWNKNSNLAWAFDTWFLNLFPRERPFLFNGGGYATLSFIPTLGTMILGLIAGTWIRRTRQDGPPPVAPAGTPLGPWRVVGYLLGAAVVCFAVSLSVDALGYGPIVKRIWTPTWTLYSGGWCFLLLAAFFVVLDVWGFKAWAFPLIVIGANSIVAYLLADLVRDFTPNALVRHLGRGTFQVLGTAYEPLLLGAAVLLVNWLILFWMYRRRLFLRI